MSTATKKLPKEFRDRLKIIDGIKLKSGGHRDLEEGACVMEAAAFVAGKPWSDQPPCVSPVIGTFLRSWNDSLPDDETRTNLLKPLIPRILGTASSPEAEQIRGLLAADWLIREFVPAWLDLVPSLAAHAQTLRSIKPIQSWDDVEATLEALRLARKDSDAAGAAARAAARAAAWAAAWAAARDAAGAAAWAAAWDAAGAAAGDAAWAAAWAAAGDAARDAAWDAAGAAAGDAARDAAWDAAGAAAGAAARDVLKPTKERLQKSALALVGRMCDVK